MKPFSAKSGEVKIDQTPCFTFFVEYFDMCSKLAIGGLLVALEIFGVVEVIGSKVCVCNAVRDTLLGSSCQWTLSVAQVAK